LAPEDPNPWELPTSEDPQEWGVTATAAFEGFPRVCERLAAGARFSFELMPLNEVPFEGYEHVVLDHRGRLFDDSEELSGEEALVRWRALVRAAYDIGGGFWIVRRDDSSDGK
jgi:hypothetical protein